MEYVMAMLRPEKLFPVKKELQKIEVNSLTVSSIAGYGSQRGYLEIDRAKLKIWNNLLEKNQIDITPDSAFLSTYASIDAEVCA